MKGAGVPNKQYVFDYFCRWKAGSILRLLFCFMQLSKPLLIAGSCCLLLACERAPKPLATEPARAATDAWMDTVRFNTKLTAEQSAQVFYKRNNEENYRDLHDTARVALRFFWWRAFHPFVIVRVENRPEIWDSAGVRKVYEEWFATYKQGVSRLNHDCPVRQNDQCSGKPLPFVHRQGVEILPVNQPPPLLAVLDSVDFWHLPADTATEAHTDGSSWTLQVYYKGRYRELSTNTTAANHPLKRICRRMIKLSGYPVKPNEIY